MSVVKITSVKIYPNCLEPHPRKIKTTLSKFCKNRLNKQKVIFHSFVCFD